MKLLRVRLPADLDATLERLKKERHVNVSSWVRAALRTDLKHELQIGAMVPDSAPGPPPPARLSSPIPGWRPRKHQGAWCSRFDGDTRALPADLVGQVIEIETQAGETWQASVLEEIERTETHALVRDSGKP